MKTDPITERVRQARQAICDRYGNDPRALSLAAREWEKKWKAGRPALRTETSALPAEPAK